MRLKSEFWVHAYIRACATANCPAFVVRHGDDDAGAPLIKINHLNGTASLYGPAPSGISEDVQGQRFAVYVPPPNATEQTVDDYINRQREYDPDLWVVEVEDAKMRHFLDGWLVKA